jgi:hypothetical protein
VIIKKIAKIHCGPHAQKMRPEHIQDLIFLVTSVCGLTACVVAWRRRRQQVSDYADQEVIERRYLFDEHPDERVEHEDSDDVSGDGL